MNLNLTICNVIYSPQPFSQTHSASACSAAERDAKEQRHIIHHKNYHERPKWGAVKAARREREILIHDRRGVVVGVNDDDENRFVH